VPLLLHVWTPLPEHSALPGAHSPVQTPATHAWLVQGTVVSHVPLVSQVWTPAPEQRTLPGTHTPVQAPCAQA
jgi:hypothetical protein